MNTEGNYSWEFLGFSRTHIRYREILFLGVEWRRYVSLQRRKSCLWCTRGFITWSSFHVSFTKSCSWPENFHSENANVMPFGYGYG